MPNKPSVSTLADLLESLTKEIPYQQVRLNYDFCDRLAAFDQLLERVKDTELEPFLLSVAPKTMTLDRVEVETSFRVDSHTEQVTSLRVQPLNLGFTRRFAYSGYVESRMEILVERNTSNYRR
jgi:hypothetical protein